MIYVFLANGFEETEAIAPLDILLRAELDVVTVGVGGQIVTGAHNIKVFADIAEHEVKFDDTMDMIVLPGGIPGTLNLEKNETVQKAIDFCVENDRYIGSICAAPSILGHKGILDGKNVTCYTGYDTQLGNAIYNADAVVCTDGKFITARGAGVSVQFGLALVEAVSGTARAAKIKASMLCE